MLEFTWKVFRETGNIETYLLMKEIERDDEETVSQQDEELAIFDSPIT
jgi:hypothetical protein